MTTAWRDVVVRRRRSRRACLRSSVIENSLMSKSQFFGVGLKTLLNGTRTQVTSAVGEAELLGDRVRDRALEALAVLRLVVDEPRLVGRLVGGDGQLAGGDGLQASPWRRRRRTRSRARRGRRAGGAGGVGGRPRASRRGARRGRAGEGGGEGAAAGGGREASWRAIVGTPCHARRDVSRSAHAPPRRSARLRHPSPTRRRTHPVESMTQVANGHVRPVRAASGWPRAAPVG